MTICSPIQISALETDYNELIRYYHLPDSFLNATYEEKMNFVNVVKNNPDAIETQSEEIVYEVNELELIRYIVNSTDEELIRDGLSYNDIAINRNMIERLNSLSDEEIIKYYDRTTEEVYALRSALKPDALKSGEELIESHKEISNNTLAFNMFLFNNTLINKPTILITVVFQWLRRPLAAFTDEIGICWGEGLASKDDAFSAWFTPEQIEYTNKTFSTNIPMGDSYPLDISYTKDSRANAAFKFIINLNPVTSFMTGQASLVLYQTSERTGRTAEIVGQYYHEVLKGGDISFGVPASAGFAIGFGYDYSKQIKLKATV